jgi:serine phosphatase RsbU (regulator of sigma subunit)
LTLLATPQSQLGGPLGAELPWVFLVGGVLLTAATALAVELLVRRRRSAERDALTIAGLYGQLDVLYGEQRSIALTLQHALLPQYNPSIPYLETATRYVAGAHGVDIGGDWYSLLHVDDQHFAFAVGDVSGRGVSAATVMARLRFTIRAYLLEGHPPDRVLAMCSEQIDISVDDHFSTVLVGIGDRATRRLTLANAGHLNPLIMTGTEARFATTAVGLPLGITPGSYEPTTVVLRPGATFLAFTDGLVERRGESLDDGLARLVGVATRPEPTLEALVSTVLAQLTEDGSEDDIAVLAFRWAEGGLDAAPPAP